MLDRVWKTALTVLALFSLAALLSVGTTAVATAANTGCLVAAGTASCTDVPADGIDYTNDPTVVEVETGNGTPGTTTVNSGVIGINLKKSGVNTSDSATGTDYQNVVTIDINPDPAVTTNWDVLADGNNVPIRVPPPSGDYIRKTGTDTFSIGAQNFASSDALAQYLQNASVATGGTVSGSLTVTNSNGGQGANFTTTNADGIHVESLGGKGGNGGCTTILLATWCDNGDGGGNAGSVAVNNDGTIVVNGTGYGVSATSTGGAGGNGGGSFGLFASDAGSGGNGGNGGDVTVVLGVNSNITTWGNGGHGVYAVSNGGNGGAGGSPSGAVALGDGGGSGGDAGEVTVSNDGSITTHGTKAYGIFAQSMGAGAGSGSSSGGIVAIGGNGGGESSGNKVTVSNTGAIETWGTDSFGILAQSIGGGGGDGGSSGGLFAVGGRGGSGGGSDLVRVFNSGTITTHSTGSAGIFAQSVGGGGGNGGNAYSGSVGVSVAVGGNGGLGGAGGKVIVNELGAGQTVADLGIGTITTGGDRSHGIQAQSIGGGGGNGGFAVAASIGQGFSLNFALGGNGAKGGSADTVVVNEKGQITTTGNQAHGIFAQSVGGGGGSGGGAVAAGVSSGYTLNLAMGGAGDEAGHGAMVTVNAMGSIDTTGALSHGILAQSVGGGGGNGGYSVAGGVGALTGSVGLGGSGAGGGNGGTVNIDVRGIDATDMTIHTRGPGSHAIFAQSVGGGGGNGGFAVGAGIGGGSISVSLGGSGSGGGTGGQVNVENRDTLLTDGAGSYGVLAQSVGGGGGDGGFSFGGAAGVMAASVAVGGKGGQGGNGGNVGVDNYGNITTQGDLSFGVLAQSIGGGGGNGGGAVAATMVISVENVPAIGASVAIGGAGGTASIGGHVILNNDGSITTGTKTVDNNGTPADLTDNTITRTGNGAHALFAQSVGGGGGTGGFAGAGTLSIGSGASFAVAVGGRGGSGGNAGIVELTNTGDAIHTWGDGADGIHAQSVGGGGGDGGFGLALAASIGGGEMTNISVGVAIGGKGGAGGTGNTVTVDNSGAITTDGAKSNGIFAQSVGGGGGTGGFAATGTVTVSQTSGGVGVSVGGGGGTGNFAQKVTVDNSGAITTYGTESLGIMAQSIGGGGGNGGLSVVAQFGVSQADSAQIGVSVGGGGGSGSYGGAVDVDNLAGGSITTYGFGSHGILAQSIGGGGGKGGMSVYGGISLSGAGTTLNAGVSVGGNGGTGGYGNTVTVENSGAVRVVADNAMGVVAQSIGGGGGDGGGSIAAMLGVTNVTNEDAATYQAVVSVGGVGGSGNYGGAVTVTNSGSIVTGSMTLDGKVISGLGGTGIFAQSVGGGGGIGGRANAINVVAGPKCSLPVICTAAENQGNNMALTATVGGNGGTGGHGGIVTVVNTGEIVTIGDTADGIFAQSIGGGGGTGGNGILGTGELLPVPVELLFIPVGQTAIYKDISVAVGGNAGASGNGALVDVTNSRNITTFGDYSNGIFAQSVGGGGGVGGKAVIGATGKIGVGGEGGASGDGGKVKVATTTGAVIETFGVASMGVYAQSVGGGGGMAGAVDRALAAGLDTPLGHLPVNLGIGLAFGQGGGAGGDGGIIDVDVTGSVLTHGDGATGVFAQSVGGGGGVLGGLGNDLPVLNLLSWHVGSNGDAGNAGVVTVDVNGLIATAGNAATGIFAQSTGGDGTASDVTVTVAGSVLTAATFAGHENDPLRGYGSVGIMAQSAGWGGNGDVIINLNSASGVVSGGRTGKVLIDASDPDNLKYADYKGIGVLIVDGKDNTLTNKGLITTADGVDAGWAILAGGSDPDNLTAAKQQKGGNEAISNFGTVTGSIDLGIGINSFVNENNGTIAGTFNSGRYVNLGDGNLLTNNGWMSTGGKSKVMTTAINGNMVQSASGIYGVDLDLAKSSLPGDPAQLGEADLIDIDGTLAMTGKVDLTLLNMGNALPGEHQVVIARSAVALTGTPELTAPKSIVATYALSQTEKELLLNYGIDFDVDGLNPNQSAIGAYVNAFQLAGGSDALEPVVASLFQIPDLETYQETLDKLSPEPYLINETLAMLAGLQFENSLMSCKMQDSVDAEGQCAWAAVNQRKTERSETDTNLGFAQTSYGLSAGVQARLNDNFVAGIGGSWEDIGTESNDTVSSTGNRFQGGAVFKGVWGNTVLAGAITGGWSSQNVSRFVDMPLGPSYVLEGTQDIGFASAHVRLSHSIEQDNWYVRPMVDVGVTQVSVDDFAETGGPVALEIEGHDETYVTVAPSVELGGEMELGDDAILRSFIRVGALDVVLGTSPQISAGFAGAPDGVDPFTITGDLDQALYDVTLGFDVISDNGATFRLTGDAKVGDTVKSYGGSMKISAPF
ncbi:autotransporter outer membrane beta-barrel domain-containing protein [Devosia sp. A16]|uniref:autotransporter outer membrane beta-barrel domain-containing protein n=1 Tax=Devosia sp. A16 TaxID=1736675 RepID=UPI0006D85691|nr:autotransporter outer membrane beta-barrel domain-containing protein [Devosia sp. A16]